MTHSIILNFIYKLYQRINLYYENSLVYRFIKALARLVQGSGLVSFFTKPFLAAPKRYEQGSFLFAVVDRFAAFIGKWLRKIYSALGVKYSLGAKAVSGSILNYKGMFVEHMFCLFIFFMVIIPHEYWNNLYILAGALFILAAYVIRYVARNETGFSIKGVAPSVLLFALTSAASLIISYDRSDSLRIFLILISCILICVLIQCFVRSAYTLKLVVFTLIGAMLVSSAYGLLMYKMGIAVRLDFVDTDISSGMSRLFATMDNPNNYAEFLIMVLPLSVSALLSSKKDITRLFIFVIIIPCILALALTYARSAYLAITFAAAVYVLFVNKRLFPFFLILSLALIPFIPASIIARIMTIGKDSSSSFRLMIWGGALRTLSKTWLIGIGLGPGPFGKIYKIYSHYMALPAMHSHNLFIQVWLETGLCGFMAFLSVLFCAGKSVVRKSLYSADKTVRYYACGLIAGLSAILFMSLVEYTWFYPRVMLTYWVIIGLAFAVGRLGSYE